MKDSSHIKDIFVKNISNFIDYANLKEFILEKAKEALKEWDNYIIDETFAQSIINDGRNGYKKLNQLVDENDPRAKEIKKLIFTLVAYCDSKAKNKPELNKYLDNRVVAQAGIRQNAWILQLLKYKLDKNNVTDAIKNVLCYISDPLNRFPIISERHRESIFRYIFNEKYIKTAFDDRLLKYFSDLKLLNIVNPLNATYIYTKLLYGLRSNWNTSSSIKGIVVRDNTNWKNEFIEVMDDNNYGVIWWSKNIVDQTKVYPILRSVIEDGFSFDYLIAEYGNVKYKANVIDFSLSHEYDQKRNSWKDKTPSWFKYNFEEYNDGKQNASIVFLVDSFIELENTIDINYLETFNGASLPVQNNMVAYTNIMNIETRKKNQYISETKSLVMKKKNIILQGAPGTGKTYKTAELAVAICNPDFKYFGNREAIMDEYNKLKIEGKIGFTTFHQSMDYEEFVEGLKPICKSNGVIFEPKAGLFKEICDKAILDTISLSKNISTDLEFDNIYDNLIEDISSKEIKSLKTRNEVEVEFERNTNNNLKFRYKSSNGGNVWSRNIVSKERLRKLYMHYNTKNAVDSIKDINKEIRSIIKGCDTSVYWTVLKYIVEHKNISEIDQSDIINLSDKEKDAIIQLFINTPSKKRDCVENVQNYVLIIDEINRGNISKILGELITLLEADKRIGENNELTAKLPYSQKEFGVPTNLYIIGTMNTADRSVGYIDYAIRRRFAFVSVTADIAVIEAYYENDESLKNIATKLFNDVKAIINTINSEFNSEDLMIGHSFFMANSLKELDMKLTYEIKPLLREYVNDGILNLSKNDKGNYDCIDQLLITPAQTTNE